MLNEIAECKEYFACLEDNSIKIIDDRLLNNSCSGLPHVLETVARYYTFENNVPAKDSKEKLDEWLKQYIDSYNGKEEIKDGLKTYRARLGKSDYFSNSFSKSININERRYCSIIADAIETGPLKKYLLLSKISEEELCENTSCKDGKYLDFRRDYTLKLTAEFLKKNKHNQKAVAITLADIGNWSTSPVNSTFTERITLKYKGKLLFEKNNDIKGRCKISFNEDWINNFKLIDAESYNESDALKEGYQYKIADGGRGKELQFEKIE